MSVLLAVSVYFGPLHYVGCLRDGYGRNRAMQGPSKIDTSMTLEMCHRFCKTSGTTYFGVEVREFNSRELSGNLWRKITGNLLQSFRKFLES